MSDASEGTTPAAAPMPLAQALVAAQRASEASTQAADDAGRAKTAREAAQEHASQLATMKGEAEATSGWFATAKQSAEESQASVTAALTTLTASKKDVADARAEVQTNRDAVRQLAQNAKTRKEALDRLADTAAVHAKGVEESNTAATTQKDAATASAARAAELLNEIVTHHAAVVAKAEEVSGKATEIGGKVSEAAALVKDMATAQAKVAEVLEVVAAHEKDLAKLKTDFSALHSRIEGLLPNATSAGLASAFRAQKDRFNSPQKWWLIGFIAAIAALLLSSLYGLPVTDTSWDSIARHLVNRLPLIAPLVWLAVYAGRHYGLALRLQEEYAYKEAVSTAFEGYKREMNTVSIGTEGGPNPLVTLCENVLKTLSQRPGRIYEGRHDDITAITPVAEATKNIAGVVTGTVKNKLTPNAPEA